MKTTLIVLMGAYLLLCTGQARAQDDMFCAQYARKATEQHEVNTTQGCGFTGPRWSAAYAGHFNWCMQGNNAQYAPGEQQAREEALRQCTGAPPVVPQCDAYAKAAVSQNNHNLMRGCGFTGPRWSADYETHYTWCTYGANVQLVDAETQARQQALDAQCPTAQGDLVAYDWCYDLETIGPGPTRLTLHPMIHNDGDRDWHSTREGTYAIGATVGATAEQANHTLRASPYWSIGAGETKILEGISLPFAETNTYYNAGSWLFNHPDDANPRNNALANRSHTALMGRDFLPGGRMDRMQCPSPQTTFCASNTSMEVTLRLRSLDVVDEADGDGNAEPYLFPFFFKIESPTPPGHRGWYHAPGGAHGNLGDNYGQDWDAGDVIPVPLEIGRWQTTLTLDPKMSEGSTYVGALVLVLEEDHFPSSQEVPGFYTRFANTVAATLWNNVAWALLVARPLPRCASCAKTLEDEVEKILKDQMSGYPVDLDDLIGVALFSWSLHDLKTDAYQGDSRVWNESTGSEDGDFTIHADILGRPLCR